MSMAVNCFIGRGAENSNTQKTLVGKEKYKFAQEQAEKIIY